MYISVWLSPDLKLKSEIFAITKAFSQKYNVYRNLRDWKGPHITLFTLKAKPNEFRQVLRSLKDASEGFRPFKVNIKNTGYFMKLLPNQRRNYVIYLKVVKSRNLQNLWLSMNRKVRNYNAADHGFAPHMTIAYKDLTKEKFYRALKEYRNFKFTGNFLVKGIQVSTRIGREHKKVIKIIKLI
jgi:2'-5' RNA ligase